MKGSDRRWWRPGSSSLRWLCISRPKGSRSSQCHRCSDTAEWACGLLWIWWVLETRSHFLHGYNSSHQWVVSCLRGGDTRDRSNGAVGGGGAPVWRDAAEARSDTVGDASAGLG